MRIATSYRQAYTLVLSLALASLLFLLTGHVGLGLGDEGHLWYGMIHTARGAVPIRDFRSYDPGRYYWAAGWSLIFGSGIVVLRIANAVFQFIGLSLGLTAVSRVTTNKWVLALAGMLLAVWMFPAHKVYEHSLAIAAVFFAVFLIERRMGKRYFIVGVFTGLTAFLLIITAAIAIPKQISPVLSSTIAAISDDSSWTRYEVTGDSLWIPREQADYVDTVRRIVRQSMGPDDSILGFDL
ncbi:MAG: hypothetical protein P8X95_16825 [Anaerolineales bacterium]